MTGVRRRSVHVPGIMHGPNPFPLGSRIGEVVCSSGIPGVDPATHTIPAGHAEQVGHAFRNLELFLAAAGATVDDVVRVTVSVSDESVRPLINNEWLRLFPDPDSRPARHTVVTALRGGADIQLEVVAVVAGQQ